ncbi:MAG: DUF1624 domain-containing protein [Clostridia bacterium]|nr:DUF1624 domain-containing protein [Clostridia bacterium]
MVIKVLLCALFTTLCGGGCGIAHIKQSLRAVFLDQGKELFDCGLGVVINTAACVLKNDVIVFCILELSAESDAVCMAFVCKFGKIGAAYGAVCNVDIQACGEG